MSFRIASAFVVAVGLLIATSNSGFAQCSGGNCSSYNNSVQFSNPPTYVRSYSNSNYTSSNYVTSNFGSTINSLPNYSYSPTTYQSYSTEYSNGYSGCNGEMVYSTSPAMGGSNVIYSNSGSSYISQPMTNYSTPVYTNYSSGCSGGNCRHTP